MQRHAQRIVGLERGVWIAKEERLIHHIVKKIGNSIRTPEPRVNPHHSHVLLLRLEVAVSAPLTIGPGNSIVTVPLPVS